ncbi:MAG: beta-ketoacyl-[acyl-carrier-protein] synthase family protein [Acidobacteriota bacterium]|jgi:3-oxoacyl-[acyl-carrier-protein] synthase II
MTETAGPFVVTGLGAVSAWGWGVRPLWQGLLSGRTAIRPLDRFPSDDQRTTLAAQAPPPPAGLAERFPEWERLSVADRFAVAATREALEGAGLSGSAALPPARTGVFFGGSTAGMFETEEAVRCLLEPGGGSGPEPALDLDRLTSQPLDNPAGAVARMLGIAGPVITVSSACASGTQALGLALDALRAGEVDVAVAGGSDSLCRLTYSGFNALRVVDPEACRPFRAGRAGMSLGEGAGILILERLGRLAERPAQGWDKASAGAAPRVLATVRGVGNSCDAHHMTAPRPDGLGASLATERALADAGAGAEEVAFLNAHGTGTPLNDASEWRGFDRVFGERAGEIPLTATKASIGHLLGSSGALEGVATVLCLSTRRVHPTPGDHAVDPETPVRLVLDRPLTLERPGLAVSTSFGFGGANAAAVFGPAPAEAEALRTPDEELGEEPDQSARSRRRREVA